VFIFIGAGYRGSSASLSMHQRPLTSLQQGFLGAGAQGGAEKGAAGGRACPMTGSVFMTDKFNFKLLPGQAS